MYAFRRADTTASSYAHAKHAAGRAGDHAHPYVLLELLQGHGGAVATPPEGEGAAASPRMVRKGAVIGSTVRRQTADRPCWNMYCCFGVRAEPTDVVYLQARPTETHSPPSRGRGHKYGHTRA